VPGSIARRLFEGVELPKVGVQWLVTTKKLPGNGLVAA
jgi:hypothetical protein